MKVRMLGGGVLLMGLVAGLPLSASAALTQCHLEFSLEGWSFFYRTASGTGTITCDNGQSAKVAIENKGGGLTFGASNVLEGHGTFSEVPSIDDLFGSYGAAVAHAGMGASTYAQIVTKGTVSLALTGRGNGVDVGVSFGKFVIERRGT